MRVELAARVVFYHPELYRTFRLNSLKESRPVLLNVLTKMPELFLEPSMPEQVLRDEEMIKTAYVAAFLLRKNPLAEELLQRYGEFLGDIHQMLIEWSTDPSIRKDRWMDIHLKLGVFQPFVLYTSSLNGASSAIKKHFDIALEVVCPDWRSEAVPSDFCDERWWDFPLLDPILKDNERLVRRMISRVPHFLQYCSDRLKDDEEFLSSIKRYIDCNYLSSRLQNSPVFRLKLANNLGGDFLPPHQVDTSSFLGKIVQSLMSFQEFWRETFGSRTIVSVFLYLCQLIVVKLIMFFVQIPDPRGALELFQPFSKEPAGSH